MDTSRTASLATFPTLPLGVSLGRRWIGASWLVDAGLVALGSAVVALLAQAQLPLPFTPVPITGQTLGVLLVGAALGAKRGAASLALYALEGGVGLPVFAGGALGWAALTGPRAGYLLGFIAAAAIVGAFADRGRGRDWRSALPAFLLGQAAIYALGALWLSFFVGGIGNAALLGIVPFLAGDAVKLALASALLPAAWKGARWLERA